MASREHDCPTCSCGRRAPVNGPPGGSVAWSEHVEAWKTYHEQHPGQSADRIAERGGFGWEEFKMFAGHYPTTWSERGVRR